MERVKSYLKLARPDHWIKQAFVLPGVVFALVLVGTNEQSPLELVMRVVLGLAATCLIASANYVLNEWLDAQFDKYHPTKKSRPMLTANLKKSWVVFEYVFLTFAGLAVAMTTGSRLVIGALILLWIMGVLYNVKPFRLKEIAYVDVLSESVNNMLRLYVGWFLVAGSIFPPVSIVLGYWMGGAFLMAAKRFAEYRMIGNPARAGLYRRSFAHYSEKSLLISAFFYALLSVFFCGIFMIKYKIELLLAIPFLCGLFCFYLNICYKPDSSAQRPERLFSERGLLLYLALLIALMCVLMFTHIPVLNILLEPIALGG